MRETLSLVLTIINLTFYTSEIGQTAVLRRVFSEVSCSVLISWLVGTHTRTSSPRLPYSGKRGKISIASMMRLIYSVHLLLDQNGQRWQGPTTFWEEKRFMVQLDLVVPILSTLTHMHVTSPYPLLWEPLENFAYSFWCEWYTAWSLLFGLNWSDEKLAFFAYWINAWHTAQSFSHLSEYLYQQYTWGEKPEPVRHRCCVSVLRREIQAINIRVLCDLKCKLITEQPRESDNLGTLPSTSTSVLYYFPYVHNPVRTHVKVYKYEDDYTMLALWMI